MWYTDHFFFFPPFFFFPFFLGAPSFASASISAPVLDRGFDSKRSSRNFSTGLFWKAFAQKAWGGDYY
jgi:hypothetical protein